MSTPPDDPAPDRPETGQPSYGYAPPGRPEPVPGHLPPDQPQPAARPDDPRSGPSRSGPARPGPAQSGQSPYAPPDPGPYAPPDPGPYAPPGPGPYAPPGPAPYGQPQAGPAPYGQPQAGPAPYGQPQAGPPYGQGQPPHGPPHGPPYGQPYPAPPPGPPSTSRRTLFLLIGGLVAAAVLSLVVLGAIVLGSGDPRGTADEFMAALKAKDVNKAHSLLCKDGREKESPDGLRTSFDLDTRAITGYTLGPERTHKRDGQEETLIPVTIDYDQGQQLRLDIGVWNERGQKVCALTPPGAD